jgi:hypothetical protein
MSCDNCDNAPLRGAYLRFGNPAIGYGNIEIVACKEHWIAARQRLLQPWLPSEDVEYLNWIIAQASASISVQNVDKARAILAKLRGEAL